MEKTSIVPMFDVEHIDHEAYVTMRIDGHSIATYGPMPKAAVEAFIADAKRWTDEAVARLKSDYIDRIENATRT